MGNYSEQQMVDYWTKIIRQNLDDYRTYVTNPALYKHLNTFPRRSKILDAGCGEGYVCRWLSEKGHEVVGVDSSPLLVAAAMKAQVGTEKYEISNLSQLSYDENSFDGVVSKLLTLKKEEPFYGIFYR